jgi:hypothetical protein
MLESTNCVNEDKELFALLIVFLVQIAKRVNQIIQLNDFYPICLFCLFLSWQTVEAQTSNWICPKFPLCFGKMDGMQILISFP